MKRTIDYRMMQKVRHGELKEITFYSPDEEITFTSSEKENDEEDDIIIKGKKNKKK